MTQWYIKELSDLTKVSVRTLHHYDQIGLFKPSVRRSNGYRLYSETDLLKLQRIIALRFFGFSLDQTKMLLGKEEDILTHFKIQAKLLQEKAQALLLASAALDQVIADCDQSKSVSWETVIKLMEVYRMPKTTDNYLNT